MVLAGAKKMKVPPTKLSPEEAEHVGEVTQEGMMKKHRAKHFHHLAKMPREAPVTQSPNEFGPRNELRMRILSMSLFPNLYNRERLLGCAE